MNSSGIRQKSVKIFWQISDEMGFRFLLIKNKIPYGFSTKYTFCHYLSEIWKKFRKQESINIFWKPPKLKNFNGFTTIYKKSVGNQKFYAEKGVKFFCNHLNGKFSTNYRWMRSIFLIHNLSEALLLPLRFSLSLNTFKTSLSPKEHTQNRSLHYLSNM